MIIAIDPGNIESGYVVLNDDLSVIEKGKVNNDKILEILNDYLMNYFELPNNEVHIAIEMIASYGMAVGATVFETCVWIGRFYQRVNQFGYEPKLIYRMEEKINLCGTTRAKDSNIIQALIDRFAQNTPNMGKGTKKKPGWFHGFKKDIWQSYAVAVTYHDLYRKGGVNK